MNPVSRFLKFELVTTTAKKLGGAIRVKLFFEISRNPITRTLKTLGSDKPKTGTVYE